MKFAKLMVLVLVVAIALVTVMPDKSRNEPRMINHD